MRCRICEGSLCVFILLVSQAVLFGGMNGNTELQVNIGPIPFDTYTALNSKFSGKCWGVTHRKCVQDMLQAYASQGVTGVRFMIAWFMAGWSTPLLDNGQVNQQWLENLGRFFDDVKAAGITRVVPTPSLAVGWLNAGEVSPPNDIYNPCDGSTVPKSSV